MGKSALRIQIGLFLTFISLFFALNIFLPDQTFSEQENRALQTAPTFSFSRLFSGRFTSEFETYTVDQFAFRDNWTALKARSELLMGKKENNDVYFCPSRYDGDGEALIERFEAPGQAELDRRMNALKKLTETVDCPVYFALIPGPSDIYSYRLPEDAPTDSQLAVIEYCYAQTDTPTVDMYSFLAEHNTEDIYYRTDHHWTSRGAYYGYSALMEAMEMDASHISQYNVRIVSDTFYGTTYSSSGFSWVKPDRIMTYVDEPADLTVTDYPQGSPVDAALYNESWLDKKDKYSFFLCGSTPLVQIETGLSDAPSLLIVRDSYTDSLVPFLLEHFSDIHVLDLRYYRTGLSAFIKEHDYDQVLVCYSVANFCTDESVIKLGQ